MERERKIDLRKLLVEHKKWLNDNGGKRADLCGTDLHGVDLSDVDLSGADLSGANLRDVNLRNANLRGADLRCADLRNADLRGADLPNADLRGTDLRGADLCSANLRGTDLCNVNLCNTDLRYTDLSGAKNILSAIDYMEKTFEKSKDGYIAYKCFNETYRQNETWEIKSGSVINENVNANRTNECGCGINVATLDWVKRHYPNSKKWRVLIRWEWLCGVCVPYNADGKIRCERVELIDFIDE